MNIQDNKCCRLTTDASQCKYNTWWWYLNYDNWGENLQPMLLMNQLHLSGHLLAQYQVVEFTCSLKQLPVTHYTIKSGIPIIWSHGKKEIADII